MVQVAFATSTIMLVVIVAWHYMFSTSNEVSELAKHISYIHTMINLGTLRLGFARVNKDVQFEII